MKFMKPYWILLSILLALVVGSCSSLSPAVDDSTTSIPKVSQPRGNTTQSHLSVSSGNSVQSINTPDYTGLTAPPSNTNQFVKLAEQNLADRLKVSVDEISFLKITDIDWQDITQGCTPTPGQKLKKGKLSGYRIWLEANGKDYVYHISLDGKIFLCPS